MEEVKISSGQCEDEESRQASTSASHQGESTATAVKGTKRKGTFDSEDATDDKVRMRMEPEDCRPCSTEDATEQSKKLSLIQASDRDNVSFMDSLPDELLLKIFKNLSLNTLINIAPVCKRWFVLSKDESLWLEVDAVYTKHRVNEFSRIIGAAKHLRTVDVSFMHADDGLGLPSLLNGLESVQILCCSCFLTPSVIVELVERYKDTLEELTVSLSDERLSYGQGGSFKDGIEPRPGYLLKLISEMKNLRVLQLTASMVSKIASYQGRINPKWYFGELENSELKVEAITINFENPREILIERFIIPFLRSKVSYLKNLCLTASIWENKGIQAIIKDCEKLEVLHKFPIQFLSALKNIRQSLCADFTLEPSTDLVKVQKDLADCEALSCIHEVSLCLPGEFFLVPIEQELVPDRRLETFLPLLAYRLKSCKRVLINRLSAYTEGVVNVHSTDGLKRFLCILCSTIEEIHIADNLNHGQSLLALMSVVRKSVHQLKYKGFSVNRLGRRGFLFSCSS